MKSRASLQFAAYIEHVKEVVLYGTADLAYWRELLTPERLFPYNDHGRAGILISVPQVVWKGARFNELSVSVAVSARADGQTADGFYLPHAFNSLRSFAFMERLFFHTPYDYAEVQVSERIPARFAVKHGAEMVCEGKMSGDRLPARAELEHFEGPVYLPRNKYFIARISGMTGFYPFQTGDMLTLKASTHEKVFQQLLESNFTAGEWRIREDAVHGKSKTFRSEKSPIAS
ncbi:MAG: hypothetical protein H6636_00155 [Anaerolineales bacterium]|nr:hypothetical protein [Anaerolineales bacterium]